MVHSGQCVFFILRWVVYSGRKGQRRHKAKKALQKRLRRKLLGERSRRYTKDEWKSREISRKGGKSEGCELFLRRPPTSLVFLSFLDLYVKDETRSLAISRKAWKKEEGKGSFVASCRLRSPSLSCPRFNERRQRYAEGERRSRKISRKA
jgi:hypothetical protein